VKLCLYSIGDNHSYLTSNRDPVDKARPPTSLPSLPQEI